MCGNEYAQHQEFPYAADPDDWAWLEGVDYLTGWMGARDVAERLNAALAAVGLPAEQVRAVAATLADGRGLVRLKATPYAARWLAVLLESLADDEQPGEGAA